MRKKLSFAVIMMVLSLYTQADNRDENNKSDKTKSSLMEQAIEKFGATEGELVTNGFVFIDGKYVDLPYRVGRKGTALFINEHKIEGPLQWQEKLDQTEELLALKKIAPNDPEMPDAITKDTSIHDNDFQQYLWEKKAFLKQHYSEDEIVNIMIGWYTTLPFIRDARRDGYYIILNTLNDGAEYRTRPFPPQRGRDAWYPENVLKRLESSRQYIEQSLKQGNCIIFFHGNRISFSGGIAAETLPPLIAILRSSKNHVEKLKKIQEKGLLNIKEDYGYAIVTNFQSSAQLEKRLEQLEALKKENEVKAMESAP